MQLNVWWMIIKRLLLTFLITAHALEHSSLSSTSRKRHHHVTHRRISRNLDALPAPAGPNSTDTEVGQEDLQQQNSGVIITFSGASARKLQKVNSGPNSAVYDSGTSEEDPPKKLWFLSYTPGAYEMALNNTYTNISSQIGREAFLHCRVGHLGDTQISWIRKRDWHVLSSGTDLITHDSRFFVIHDQASRDWTLHIKRVTLSDAGTYECQVSTGQGIISMFVKLKVITPVVQILGTGSFHANMHSTIQLTCIIKQSFYTKENVIWERKGEILNFLKLDPKIQINNTEKILEKINLKETKTKNGREKTQDQQNESELLKEISSQLTIEKADLSHSGNYTCSTQDGISDSTMVFITEGDNIAAVQRIDSKGHKNGHISFTNLILSTSLLYYITR